MLRIAAFGSSIFTVQRAILPIWRTVTLAIVNAPGPIASIFSNCHK